MGGGSSFLGIAVHHPMFFNEPPQRNPNIHRSVRKRLTVQLVETVSREDIDYADAGDI
jgi:hypothetical protein